MRPHLDAFIEMQLPPLEQTVVTDVNNRSTRVEDGDERADQPQILVGANS